MEVATTTKQLEEVEHLTYLEYTRLGYITENSEKRISLCPELDLIENSTIFIIRGGRGEVIGTVTLTIDGPEGLHTDHTFPNETEGFRQMVEPVSQRLAGMWRIITKDKVEKCIVGRLIDEVWRAAEKNNVDVSLATFNPHHKSFYHRMGFDFIAEAGNEFGMMNAPTVLMLARTEDRNWAKMRHHFFCD